MIFKLISTFFLSCLPNINIFRPVNMYSCSLPITRCGLHTSFLKAAILQFNLFWMFFQKKILFLRSFTNSGIFSEQVTFLEIFDSWDWLSILQLSWKTIRLPSVDLLLSVVEKESSWDIICQPSSLVIFSSNDTGGRIFKSFSLQLLIQDWGNMHRDMFPSHLLWVLLHQREHFY